MVIGWADGRTGRAIGGRWSIGAAVRGRRPRLRAVAILLFGLAGAASSAAAQNDTRLVEAVRMAQEGSSDSARATVRRLLAATSPTDSLYPEILYTQAMVAGDAGDMRRDLQRVAVEYGASEWADDALLRLVQMDYASRNLEGAARNLERLRSDYPATSLLPQAAYWAGRTYFDLKNPTLACRWLADGMARAPDIEVQNQLGYLFQRCGTAEASAATDSAAGDSANRLKPDSAGAPAAPADTTRPRDSLPRPADSTSAPSPPPAPGRTAAPTPARAPTRAPARPSAPARARYRVQVSAVATPGAADDAASKVEKLGYESVIVREGKLYKVRAGSFQTRQEAQAAAAKLKASLGGSPFTVAEP
jgi:sporulation related protein